MDILETVARAIYSAEPAIREMSYEPFEEKVPWDEASPPYKETATYAAKAAIAALADGELDEVALKSAGKIFRENWQIDGGKPVEKSIRAYLTALKEI